MSFTSELSPHVCLCIPRSLTTYLHQTVSESALGKLFCAPSHHMHCNEKSISTICTRPYVDLCPNLNTGHADAYSPLGIGWSRGSLIRDYSELLHRYNIGAVLLSYLHLFTNSSSRLGKLVFTWALLTHVPFTAYLSHSEFTTYVVSRLAYFQNIVFLVFGLLIALLRLNRREPMHSLHKGTFQEGWLLGTTDLFDLCSTHD